MAHIKVYESLVEDDLHRVECETEAGYYDTWKKHALPREADLLAMAVAGGMVADRLAWVFVAGYQAACRHAFPSAAIRGWVSYAATEDGDPGHGDSVSAADREGRAPLPGVSLGGSPSARTLTGHKTWVAAANHVEQLVIKVGTGPAAQYFLIDRARPGLTISTRPGRDWLSELSQGGASLDNTPVSDADSLGPGQIGQLGLFEPLYMYAAFCGLVLGSTTKPDLVSCSHDCLDGVEPAIASLREGHLDRVNLHKADARAQDLLVRLEGNRIRAEGDWESDQGLIAMYSSNLEDVAAAPDPEH